MENFPKTTTKRLVLSRRTGKDIPSIVKFAGNKKIAGSTLNIPHPYQEEDAIYWITSANDGLRNGGNLILGIRLKDGRLIAGIGLSIDKKSNRAEIGYWVAESFWNNGYTAEATKALIAYGFEKLALNKFTSSHYSKNPASGKVMQKSGMKKEGELKEHVLRNSAYHTLICYGLTKTEYLK